MIFVQRKRLSNRVGNHPFPSLFSLLLQSRENKGENKSKPWKKMKEKKRIRKHYKKAKHARKKKEKNQKKKKNTNFF